MTVKPGKSLMAALLFFVATAAPLHADEEREAQGKIFTFWPLVDYRESSAEDYSNLSVLGPIFKLQWLGEERTLAVRPFLYDSLNTENRSEETDYLYPLASSTDSSGSSTFQVLQLYQKNVFRGDEGDNSEKGTMLFPFYISGTSEKFGPYRSFFPFYGDIYERFWRDEYHFVMFPLYGRTVKKGTTTSNFLYPLFSLITGEDESGFQLWPLYGQSEKKGVYKKRFALWPFFHNEESGIGGDNPTSRLYVLPLYVSIDSPRSSARYYLWPFFGWKSDREGHQEERDYLWPFWRTVRGEKRNLDSWLPFYLSDVRKETRKQWLMWPLYKKEEMVSEVFHREKHRILYFLYTHDRQSWPKAQGDRVRAALWPFFVYNRNPRGIKSLGIPAPVEPILDKEGIEKSWAPLWRIYQQRWNDRGDSAVSFLWNLYWHEKRGRDLAFEFFPVLSYRSEGKITDIRVGKGLIGFRNDGGKKALSVFWLPFNLHWGGIEASPMEQK